MRRFLFALLALSVVASAADEFPPGPDSKPQQGIAKGTMIKDAYTAKDGSVFPGTQREYQIYLPAGHDKAKPAVFMVFQDGVIYQAPVVFDNLIAKKDIPPLVGIFIKPGVVPAANDNALPRFNRSYEYDSVTPNYSQFLIDEFLPAIEAKHGLKLSTDPNHAAISGNSSGGICAFMVAWHRSDRFRRVFTGVGTYVGIHGADQLPVLVRKFEPKPLRVFLQSGTGDNNLYCGDWWMANQMMERSLTWAGYDVNHTWGEGGHNAKHATQIFPDVLRWLWRDWQTSIEVKANPKGESKWKGYEVVGAGEWSKVYSVPPLPKNQPLTEEAEDPDLHKCKADAMGTVYAYGYATRLLIRIADTITKQKFKHGVGCLVPIKSAKTLRFWQEDNGDEVIQKVPEQTDPLLFAPAYLSVAVTSDSRAFLARRRTLSVFELKEGKVDLGVYIRGMGSLSWLPDATAMCLSPDQTQLYLLGDYQTAVSVAKITRMG
ncbi:MAG: alpha/beta hydrolase-fold protein [Verrucomicrobiaceae bacterium]